METDPNETQLNKEGGWGEIDSYFSVKLISVTHSRGIHAVMLTDAMQRMMTWMEKSVKGLPKQL